MSTGDGKKNENATALFVLAHVPLYNEAIMTAARKISTATARIMVGIILTARLLLPVSPVHAADFDISINRSYTVSESGETLHISERRTLTNRSSAYYLPATSVEEFIIQNFKEGFDQSEIDSKTASIRVTDGNGRPLDCSTQTHNEEIVVEVPFSRSVTPGQSIVFQLEYDADELVETVGSVINVYIPGLDESYQQLSTDPDTHTTTQISYTTTLTVPKTMPPPTFTLPLPASTSETTVGTVYTFSTESIIGTSVWHQIGNRQTYAFKIAQPVLPWDTTTPKQLSFLSKGQYTIILPRNYAETNQDVFFTTITPDPHAVWHDDDGNVFASFVLDATQESTIFIEGYITVELTGEAPDLGPGNGSTVLDIPADGSMDQYLQAAEFWESDDPEIVQKAEELAREHTTIIDILRADYEFIIDLIDYDDFKYGARNTRRGALAALHGESSVCMEYADLLIALARSQGIPARAAYGYGYDPRFSPNEQEDHQWVQAWVPEYGWLTIDPTWGETGREFIGRDLDHALWYVASVHPDEPNPLEIVTADISTEPERSSIEISAVNSIPENTELLSASDLENRYGSIDSNIDRIYLTIQTSMLGRVTVTLLPVCSLAFGVVAFFTIIVRIVRFFVRRTRRPPPPPAFPPISTR